MQKNKTIVPGVMALLASAAAGAGEAPQQAPQQTQAQIQAPEVPDENQSGIDYILRAGGAYSDNLYRGPPGTEDAVGSASVGVEMHGQRDTGRLTYDVGVDLSYYEYFENIDGETFGRAALNGRYAFVPDAFFWNASLGFDQYRDDLSRPMVPGNIDDQLSFSTGPELRLRMGSVMELQGEAHYQVAQYSQSDLDTNTIGGRLLLGRRSSPLTFLAIGASLDQVNYQNDLASQLFDFDRSEVFARFEHRNARTNVAIEAGYSEASGDTIDDNSPVYRANLSHRLTPTLRGDLSYVREYATSAGTSYQADPTVPGGGEIDNTALSASPRILESFGAGLTMTRPRTRAMLGYTKRREISLIEILGERDYSEIRGRIERRFTPKATGTLFAYYTQDEYSAFAQDFDEFAIGGMLTILFGRSLGLDLRVEHHSQDAAAPDPGFRELSWGLFFRYSGAFGRRTSLEEDIGLD